MYFMQIIPNIIDFCLLYQLTAANLFIWRIFLEAIFTEKQLE